MTIGLGAPAALKNFEVLQELQGERGNKIYLARGKSGAVVAIKVLASRAIDDDQSTALSKEASLGARLQHDAILQTKALLVEKDFAAVVTEFIPGVSLQRLVRFATGRGVRLPDVCAWYIFERILAGLASAHSAKDAAGSSKDVVAAAAAAGTSTAILHRGVSASSVVVGWDGTVKIGDFGLVRMRQIVSKAQTATPKSERDVAPLMAPEEARGDKPDARSDVYCAALVAIRLATGRTPYARFRNAPSEMFLAISEGNVTRFAQTRPDLPEPLRDALDMALEPDRDKRQMTADQLLAAVRANTDITQGKAALAKLLGRWKEAIETSVSPWERRASMHDDANEDATGLVKEGTLMIATPDERPSDASLISGDKAPDEPWKKDKVPAEEVALTPTDPITSLSRVGSTAPDALVMPLPAMRITMPELPTYGGPAVNVARPKPKQGILTGGVAAAVIATMFVVLIGGAIILFRWLLGPGSH